MTQKRPLSERADTVLARAFERAIDDKEMLRAAAASLNRRLARDDLSATLVELVLYELRARALGER